ncbi:hypothetical protein TYRP_020719 [Tyrophagus putrescentiae]|nr:hypothetical protein TYRP_020719 [Tyrophagus putrescentiae]
MFCEILDQLTNFEDLKEKNKFITAETIDNHFNAGHFVALLAAPSFKSTQRRVFAKCLRNAGIHVRQLGAHYLVKVLLRVGVQAVEVLVQLFNQSALSCLFCLAHLRVDEQLEKIRPLLLTSLSTFDHLLDDAPHVLKGGLVQEVLHSKDGVDPSRHQQGTHDDHIGPFPERCSPDG